MILRKGYKFRLEPIKTQRNLFFQFAGAGRWVFNRGLAQKKDAWKINKQTISLFAQNKELTLLKNKDETAWLKTIHSQVLQQSLQDLDSAYKNFFRGLKKKENPGFPKFKVKGFKDSFRYPQGVKVEGSLVFLPKIGWIKFRKSREIKGIIKQSTIIREGDNWFVSFNTENEIETPKPILDPEKTVGIDLGLKSFATLAIGKDNHLVTIENPKYLRKKITKLQFLSRQLSKKVKKSKNRYKAIKKLSSFHSHLKNLRLDFFHKQALTIVKSHDIINIEKMNVKGMLKGLKNLSRAINDAAWSMFVNCLKNKAIEYGKTLNEISSLMGSTKHCSKCGHKNDITLKERTYICSFCGQVIDRDLNAAINIKAAGSTV